MIFIIPALNEENTLPFLLRRLFSLFPNAEVVVVDDASEDETARLAATEGATVLRLPFRLGYWGALQAGLLYGYRQGHEIFITMDADGQHPPEETLNILKVLEESSADIIIGACPERGNMLKKMAWSFFRILTGLKVKDLTSGFRAYRRPAVKILIDVDFLVLDNADLASLIVLHQQGLNIIEVPVKMKDRSLGKSKIFASPIKILRYLLFSFILSISKRKFAPWKL